MIITIHAKERILERLGCKECKVEKVVDKAYRSKEKVSKSFVTKRKFNGYENVEYRVFQGCVFCFSRTEKNQPILITVLMRQ